MEFDHGIPLVVLSLLAGAAVIFGFTRHVRQRRRLTSLASKHALSFHGRDPFDLSHRFGTLTIMRQGHDRGAMVVLAGAAPYGSLFCFEYQYEVGFGAVHSTRRWAVAVVEADGGERVTFCLRHRSLCGGPTDCWDEWDRRP
ncbi:MAG: hypothetical protein RBU21_20375, partial [FCB group bacterium]|nr:hypothetical protein [FCB group bacterium]